MAEALQVIAFENVQHLERRNSLRLGAEFVNVVTSIVRRHRHDPLRIEFRKIRQRAAAAALDYLAHNSRTRAAFSPT